MMRDQKLDNVIVLHEDATASSRSMPCIVYNHVIHWHLAIAESCLSKSDTPTSIKLAVDNSSILMNNRRNTECKV